LNAIPSPTGANKIVCTLCSVETQLSPQFGVDGLLTDYGLEAMLRRSDSSGPTDQGSLPPVGDEKQQDVVEEGIESVVSEKKRSTCTGCKSGEAASSYCATCPNHLCANCTQAHRFMHCFEGHQVEDLPPAPNDKCKCLEHQMQPLIFFCATCNLAVCRECTQNEHTAPTHQVESLDDVAETQIAAMEILNMEVGIEKRIFSSPLKR